MAVLAPLPQQWVNAPSPVASVPALATSQFSSGGILAPTTAAATSINATNPNGYSNSSSNPYSNGIMTPQGQTQQQSNPVSSILSNGSSIKSAGQFISNGFQLPQSQFINGIGSQMGFASGASSIGGATESISPALAAADPSLVGTAGAVEGGTFGASTLSSTLGAAGLGALAGNFLGKIGGNSTNGSIGGAIGAGIGNLVLPGIGGIVGGLIGGIGGGFFGGKSKPTAASQASWKTDDAGNLSLVEYGEKNPGQYAGFNTNLNTAVTTSYNKAKDYLATQGITLKSPTNFGGGVNTLHSPASTPGFMNMNGKVFGFDPNDYNSINGAVGQSIGYLAKQSGATDDQIRIMSEQLAKDAQVAQSGGPAPMIPNKTTPTNTSFTDFVNAYKASLNPQGNTNAPTTSTAPTVTPNPV